MDPNPIPPPSSPHAARVGIGLILSLVVFLAALVFGAWGVWQGARRSASVPCDSAAAAVQAQRVATLTRSDQISRAANGKLQATLGDREEQIAGLRADVDFYERLVGPTAQRHGLSLHALRFNRQPGGAWHFLAVLTGNVERDAVNTGVLSLSVEGSAGGSLRTLDWATLRQQPAAPGVDYSFRYFQQVEGDVFVPAGFVPVTVRVQLRPRGGAMVQQAVTWAEATAPGGPRLPGTP